MECLSSDNPCHYKPQKKDKEVDSNSHLIILNRKMSGRMSQFCLLCHLQSSHCFITFSHCIVCVCGVPRMNFNIEGLPGSESAADEVLKYL